MFNISIFPLRQKIFIGLTVLMGVFLFLCSQFSLLRQDTLNQFISFYGIGIPLFLLMFDTVVDLNGRNVFGVWLSIAILIFIISLSTYSSENYVIQRSSRFDKSSGVNYLIGDYSTSSLKALIIFLITYWLLNRLLNRKGLFIINTFRQTSNAFNDDVEWSPIK